MNKKILILVGLWSCTLMLWAQPEARFLSHRIKTGQPITLRLALYHNGDSQWIFPDSTSSFGAFELIEKRPFPTQKTDTGFVDSAHYVLRTFEIDTVLSLRLALIAVPGDTIFCVSDSVSVVPTEKQAPQNSLLYINTFFRDLWTIINWNLILTVVFVFVLALGAVFLVFGKKIKTSFLLKRLLREKIKFIMGIDALIAGEITKNNAREALVLWKNFCGKLTKLPLESYTSAETSRTLSETNWIPPDRELYSALYTLDVGMYAGIFSEKYKEDLKKLKQIALEIYEKKVYLLKNEPKSFRSPKPSLV